MSDIWFTSDTHYHHKRILEFCRDTRRGDTYEEMTELAIEAYNSVVKRGDTVYHLGDFSFGGKSKIIDVKSKLNGQIHLILGNHDRIISKSTELKMYFASVRHYRTITLAGYRFVLFHFPLAEWEDCHKGVIMLHGHTHGNKENLQYQQVFKFFDVGIDNRPDNKMLPWNIEEVINIVKNRDTMSHHSKTS